MNIHNWMFACILVSFMGCLPQSNTSDLKMRSPKDRGKHLFASCSLKSTISKINDVDPARYYMAMRRVTSGKKSLAITRYAYSSSFKPVEGDVRRVSYHIKTNRLGPAQVEKFGGALFFADLDLAIRNFNQIDRSKRSSIDTFYLTIFDKDLPIEPLEELLPGRNFYRELSPTKDPNVFKIIMNSLSGKFIQDAIIYHGKINSLKKSNHKKVRSISLSRTKRDYTNSTNESPHITTIVSIKFSVK